MWGYVQFSAKNPGKGKEKFARRPDEKVKWALRKIYYAEWAYYEKNGSFGADIGALGLKGESVLKVKGWSYPPAIQRTKSLFEAVYASKSGESWRIRQDGLIWKDSPEKSGAK
jgi:hypothetical protein